MAMQDGNGKRRWHLFLFYSAFCILHSALLAGAAPVPTPPPAAPPAANTSNDRPLDENEQFARSLVYIVNWTADSYVHPVSRAELLQTALTSLYETARRQTPRNLRQRIDRAEKEIASATCPSPANGPIPVAQAIAPGRPPLADERPLLELVRSVRADTGRVENFGGADPLRICCHAMLRSLDPYSGVITANEDRRSPSANSQRDGFGLDVAEGQDVGIVIRDVLPGSPAQISGLRPGDEITRLHDSDGRSHKLKDSLNVLNGRTAFFKPENGGLGQPQPIKLTYRRKGIRGEQLATLECRHFHLESVFGVARLSNNAWNYWLDREHKIAHLRLGSLAADTPDELGEILEQLRRDGLRGLILDLRWCPGGDLLGSTRTAELFLGDGTIATVQNRNGPEKVFRSTSEDKHNAYPIVVLVNSDSTGGAEMIAAALQDHHRAVVLGQRTHGKGNVQSLMPFPTMRLKLTSGTLIRPSGKPLHRFPDSKPDDDWGVRPDPGREFRISPDLSCTLRTWWEEQTMRPGSSTKRLPLDDPLADPQRNAAAEALTELMKPR